MRYLITAVLIALITAAVSCSRQPQHARAPVEGMNVVIDTISLAADKPVFYTYRHEGRNVNFFVLKTGGRVLSFLDACETCYPRKRGYALGEGSVVCRACGQSYPLGEIENGVGGCYPIRLPGRTEGGRYLISLSDLVTFRGKF